MSYEASEQYAKALKSGQKYLKNAQAQGNAPYPAVLDEIEAGYELAGRAELGLVNVPSELIVGTRSAGRVAALAGNFMPLLEADSEFAAKWMRLCDAHTEEGIRDPILAFEFLGKFYVQEGNKRVSVLRSYDAPSIPAMVTRILPARSEDPEIKRYYEFLQFYALSGLYGLSFEKLGSYARLQAALGMEEDHVWTEDERRSFRSGFYHRFYSQRRSIPSGTNMGETSRRTSAPTGTSSSVRSTVVWVVPTRPMTRAFLPSMVTKVLLRRNRRSRSLAQ